MEPRIQYVKTSDGVNIAYSSFGTGPALVCSPDPVWGTNLSAWQVPEARACYERMARGRMLVGYDSRGTGESDRGAKDYSLEGLLRDLDAVVDATGIESFALLGEYFAGPVAIAYAARYPERVSHLILRCALAATSTYSESSYSQAFSSLRSMAGQEWELYVKTMVYTSYSGAGGDLLQRLAELWRRSVSPSELPAILAGAWTHDASSLLSQVRTPTLVIHWRDNKFSPMEEARRIAASIPGAELVVLEGEDPWPDVGRTEAAARAIDEFLGESEPIAHISIPGGPVTVLFTDITGSTALTQRLGDARAQELLRTHNTIVRDALKAHGGGEIKHTGDGIMASFPFASSALQAAIDIQWQVQRYGEEHRESSFRVRIGLNAGEPVVEEQDLYGTAVQLAARVCSQAEGGEILVSNVVRELAAGKGFLFSDRGDFVAKGFEDPVRVFEVSWRTTTASL
jgi:class 3 adenylate cyclase